MLSMGTDDVQFVPCAFACRNAVIIKNEGFYLARVMSDLPRGQPRLLP